MAASDSRPVPIKNTAYRVIFPILDADGDLVTGATGLDSEVSKDCGTFADCTNEATEIATSSGMYYLDLTSTEMNADSVAVIVKTSTSGAKTTPIVLYPQESGDIKVDVQSYGGTAGTFSGGRPEVNTTHAAGTAWGSGAITAASLASGAITSAKFAASAIDATAIAADAITAAKIADGAIDLATFAADAKALMGVVAFGTAQSVTGTTIRLASAETFADDELIGATVLIRSASTGAGQARVITDYVSATDTATVDTWTTTPTGTITYVVFATPPASTSAPIAANVTQWNGSTVATPNTAGVPKVDVTQFNGSNATSASGIPEVKVNNIAANAITAASMASDAGAEIADAVWDEATSGHTTAGTTGKALTDASSAGDPWSTALPGAYSSGTAGYLIGTYVDAPISTVDTVVDAIKAKTDNLPASPAATGDIPTAVQNADALLGRNVAGGSSAGRLVKEALYVLRNKTAISGGTLTVYGTDDTTSAFTATVTTAASDPVSSIDPA